MPCAVRRQAARQRDQLVAAVGERRDEHPERRQHDRLAVARAQHRRRGAVPRRAIAARVAPVAHGVRFDDVDAADRVVGSLLHDDVRPRHRRPDALAQVHQVDAAPDVAADGAPPGLDVEPRELPRRTIRAGAPRTARGTGPRTTPPSPPPTRAGRRATSSRSRELQRVRPLRAPGPRARRSGGARRQHVVGHVGVDRHRRSRARPRRTASRNASTAGGVVALGKALAVHEIPGVEHGVGVEEPVGGDDLDPVRARTARRPRPRRCSCRPPRPPPMPTISGASARGPGRDETGQRRVPVPDLHGAERRQARCTPCVRSATGAIPVCGPERERMRRCRPWTPALPRARDAPQRGCGAAPARTRRPARRPVTSSACGTCPVSTGSARSRSPRVLLYHADLDWIPGGFLGVDVFFVISGLPDHVAAARRVQEPGPDRPRPVLPAPRPAPAARAVPACSASSASSPSSSCPTRSRSCAATSSPRSLYGTNWWQIFRNVSYFEAAGRPPLLQHLWSLAVEEQFYLIWPLLLTGMFKLWHGRRRPMLLATLAIIAVSVGLDDRPLDQPRLPDRARPVARLLRHRHPRVHDAHRRGARDGVGTVAALGQDDARRPARPRRRRASSGCSGSRGCSST